MTRTPMGLRGAPKPSAKPASNVYTVLLVVAFVFLVAAIVFNEMHLMGRYGLEFVDTIWPFK